MSDIQQKIRKMVPWIFKGIRIPKVNFPSIEDRNLDLPSPTRNFVLIVIYVVLFFLLSGGVYLNITDSFGNKPIALGSQGGQPLWVYPSINDAFIIESIVAAAVIFIGGFGFMFLYQATKNLYNPSYAQKLIALGFAMALFAFVFLQYFIVNLKAPFLLD